MSEIVPTQETPELAPGERLKRAIEAVAHYTNEIFAGHPDDEERIKGRMVIDRDDEAVMRGLISDWKAASQAALEAIAREEASFCACGRRGPDCDGSRRGCAKAQII